MTRLVDEEPAGGVDRHHPGVRARQLQNRLLRHPRTAGGRLTLQWFRAYIDASRNSGCAATVYSSLSVFPAALVIVACSHPSQGNANVFAERLVTHLRLTGSTARLVEETFGSASANALGATMAVVISASIWGIGIGQIYQDVYARAWGIKVGSAADQGLFVLFFFILTGAIAFAIVAMERYGGGDLLVRAPAWFIASTAFWLFVPHVLLHGKVALRALLPGAVLASVAIGTMIALSPLFVAPPLNEYGKAFGSFGVVLTTIGYLFVVITTSLVCAVFAPVWTHWRETERAERVRPTGSSARSPSPSKPGA